MLQPQPVGSIPDDTLNAAKAAIPGGNICIKLRDRLGTIFHDSHRVLIRTHELHREVTVPPGDLLLYAGDFTFFSKRRSKIDDFNDWLGDLPHRYKVVIYGNHEFALESEPDLRSRLPNAVVLVNEAAKIDRWGLVACHRH